ncbi:MAG: ABC transporter ATP-binding protein/permease [Methanoregulaceae archaeon]|jgi:ATP-binding cassette subfamily B protein|nr:ABC transporter ATP-binding protein/permease [Methanoregulaceae archaeon]
MPVILPNLSRMLVIYKGAWGWIALSQLFVLLGAMFMLLIPVQISALIDKGVLAGDIGVVVDKALLMLLFAILAGAFSLANLYIAARVGEGTAHYLRKEVYKKIQTFSFGNLDRIPVGELLVRLTSDIYQINMAASFSVRFVLYAPFMILVALVFVYISSPDLVWIFIVVIMITAAMFGIMSWVLQGQYRVRQQNLDAVNNVLQEDFSGVRVIKAFVRQYYENNRFKGVNEKFRTASLSPLRTSAFILPAIFLILGLSNALVIWFGGLQVIAGTMGIGEIIAFTQYFFFILAQLWILSFVMPQIISAEASAGRLAGIIDTKPTVVDSPQAAMPDPARLKGRVVFWDVSFSYEGPGGKEAIKHISFTAEPGQTIAFLGPTGSGKSTLVNLIPRFYDVTSGRITIDGTDVRDIPQDELRSMVYIALQESVLFSGTIKENIGFGGSDIPFDQLVAASRAAEADEFISAIPSGYDSHVARRGANFSGGQKQRLSIARAIAPKPRILILDDSTSAVDVATESRIQAALATMIPGTTRLIVAQRISTVLMADKIILLDKGEIVEMGNHQELISRSPLYQEIFESQLGGITREDIA